MNKIQIETKVVSKNGIDNVLLKFPNRKSFRNWKRELDKNQKKENKMVSQGLFNHGDFSSDDSKTKGQTPSPVETFMNNLFSQVFGTLRQNGELTTTSWTGQLFDHKDKMLFDGEFHKPPTELN